MTLIKYNIQYIVEPLYFILLCIIYTTISLFYIKKTISKKRSYNILRSQEDIRCSLS